MKKQITTATVSTLVVLLGLYILSNNNSLEKDDIIILKAPRSTHRIKVKPVNDENTDIRIFNMIEDDYTEASK